MLDLDSALHLQVVAGPRAAAEVRRELREWLRRLDWPPTAASDIVLAVTEAVSNSAIHAYPRRRPGPVRVEARVTDAGRGERRVELIVADEGRWRATLPSGPEQPSHGLASMRATMAVTLVSTTERGTTALLHSVAVPRRTGPRTHPDPHLTGPG